MWEVPVDGLHKILVEWGAEFDNFDPVTQVRTIYMAWSKLWDRRGLMKGIGGGARIDVMGFASLFVSQLKAPAPLLPVSHRSPPPFLHQILHRTVSVNVFKGEDVALALEEIVPQRQYTVQVTGASMGSKCDIRLPILRPLSSKTLATAPTCCPPFQYTHVCECPERITDLLGRHLRREFPLLFRR